MDTLYDCDDLKKLPYLTKWQTDRQTDRQTEACTHTHTYRQADKGFLVWCSEINVMWIQYTEIMAHVHTSKVKIIHSQEHCKLSQYTDTHADN